MDRPEIKLIAHQIAYSEIYDRYMNERLAKFGMLVIDGKIVSSDHNLQK